MLKQPLPVETGIEGGGKTAGLPVTIFVDVTRKTARLDFGVIRYRGLS